jgi:phosphoribosylformylglycinamidine synthase
MKIGVVVFPGSNCDHDCEYVFKEVLGQSVEMIWHKDTSLSGLDAIVLPGGFSYGDYLRTGASHAFLRSWGWYGTSPEKAALSWESVTGFRFFSKRVCYRALC